MASVFQPKFLRFHENIKLVNTEENATLREKRDRVLQRMRDNGLSFEPFNQGSYAMGTGVIPVGADYDIDVGVIFTGAQRPADPMAAKKWVYDAVHGHTTTVEWRRHCIRVQYVKAGAATYHVDLPVYWKDAWGNLSLAVGKQNSGVGYKEWQEADPKGLVSLVANHLSGEDRMQFRRVIRALKRWKDVHFPVEGNAKPVGIGITLAALQWFSPSKDWGATTSAGYDDLQATTDLVNRMRSGFGWSGRLSLSVPVKPRKDVFERMTDQQMKEFKERLDTLSTRLANAKASGSTTELVRAFGADFPA